MDVWEVWVQLQAGHSIPTTLWIFAIVKLTAHADASYTLEWADALVTQFAINKTAVSTALEAAASDGGGGAALRARIAATPWRP